MGAPERRGRPWVRTAVIALATLALLGSLLLLILRDDSGSGDPFVERSLEPREQKPNAQPNIVVVMSDDQAMSTLGAMPNVQEHLADQGTTFARSYVSLSLCCPSRATLFTGQLAHNHGILGTKVPPDEPEYETMRARMEAETLPIWLLDAGYETAHIGKWLHGYGDYAEDDPPPPGWAHWFVPLGFDSVYDFTDFTVSENGEAVSFEGDDQYSTDVFTNEATEFIAAHADDPKPFFMVVAYVAPHVGTGGDDRCEGGAQPADRHEETFADVALPAPPSFNEEDVSDKPEIVQKQAALGAEELDDLKVRYACQLESLQAVDEGVGEIHDALAESGILKNTYFVYTSDNGFMNGEHRFTGTKLFPYEPSLRVPMLIRGPGVPEGATKATPILNVDLPATILDWARAEAEPGVPLDGRSFAPLFEDDGNLPPRDMLFEGYVQNDSTNQEVRPLFASIARDDLFYTQWRTGEAELYDLEADPHQLESLHENPAYANELRELSVALDGLRRCAGTAQAPVPRRVPCG